MKRVFILLVLLILGIALVMCGGEKKDEFKEEAQQTVVADTGKAVCPGCAMEMEKSKMVAHETDGETEYFCSEECKDNYLASKEGEKSEEAPPPPAQEN